MSFAKKIPELVARCDERHGVVRFSLRLARCHSEVDDEWMVVPLGHEVLTSGIIVAR